MIQFFKNKKRIEKKLLEIPLENRSSGPELPYWSQVKFDGSKHIWCVMTNAGTPPIPRIVIICVNQQHAKDIEDLLNSAFLRGSLSNQN